MDYTSENAPTTRSPLMAIGFRPWQSLGLSVSRAIVSVAGSGGCLGCLKSHPKGQRLINCWELGVEKSESCRSITVD